MPPLMTLGLETVSVYSNNAKRHVVHCISELVHKNLKALQVSRS